MKLSLNPLKWFVQPSYKPEAAYAKKIFVVTECSNCPHEEIPSYTHNTGNPECGITGKIIKKTDTRPNWCPLSTDLPEADELVLWEGEVCRD